MPQFVEEATEWLSDQNPVSPVSLATPSSPKATRPRSINTSTVTPGWTLSVFDWNIVLFGVLIIVFLIFEPLGMYGIWVKIRNYWKRWPFSY